MGQPEEKVVSEFWQFMSKIGLGALYIIPAVVAKIAAESRGNKFTWKQIAVKVIISICVGALAFLACERFGYKAWGAVVVPVATLLGESLVIYLLTNGPKIYDNLIGRFINGKKNGNETKS